MVRQRSSRNRRRRVKTSRWLTLALLVGATSLTAYRHEASPEQSAGRRTAATAVAINRTVPSVSAPPARPVFSATPTELEIRRARVFPEPLMPLGEPSSAETLALAGAIGAYTAKGQRSEIGPFTDFLRADPTSPWRASLLANLGVMHRASGYYTRALRAWDDAWTAAHSDASSEGRAVADMAAASALDTLATLGNLPGLDRWLERTQGRAMSGPAAARESRAREARAFIVRHPDRVIASGPKALEVLLHWRATGARAMPRDQPPVVPAALKAHKPTAAGTSLAEVRELASKVGLSMTAVRREAGAAIPVPSIVHLGFDHFSAVLEEVNGRYRVRDPALGGEVWMPREALEEETTGAALVLGTSIPEGWRELTDAEAAAIVGHSCPPGIPSPDERPCPDSEPGMPTYCLHPTQASVLLTDTPVGYAPPRGPSVSAIVRYNHREENQPQLFTFANFGPKWTMNWLSYVEEVPWTWFDEGFAMPNHVAVHVPEGAVERYAYPTNGVYPRHYRSAAVLVQTSINPLTFERRHADGSKEVYSRSDGGVAGMRRIFLTAIVDPHGQALTLTWDAQLRLVAVTDALSQVTTLQYEDGDPLKVTSVVDPFGRIARFTYDSAGHLETVTDVIQLTSRFVYGYREFIAAMQTPYGTTTFREPVLPGEYKRAVEALDPLGAVERLEFHWMDAPVPATVPAGEVPAGFEPANVELNTLTSLHWKKGRNVANVHEAVQWRWLMYSLDWFWDPGWTVQVPHSVRRPGEARTWYAYEGVTARPWSQARKLPDGTVSKVNSTYNVQDNVTWTRDPVGRETTYTYAANGIDLLQVRNTTAGRNDVLATYNNYTAGHLPQTVTDAAGQTTAITYNSFGQVLTVTNPKQETTSNTYDPNGYLQTVTGPVSDATVTYAYDAYGRVRSATPAGEGVVTTDYDALNRPTRTTYPDETYEETTYVRLDAAARRDRRGRLTHFTYDANRQLVATRDPAGRVIQQQYCSCGALDALIDANGNSTKWERDAAGRVLREVRADGTTSTTYMYDALGRVKTVIDPKQQVTTYTYALDGSVATVAYTNAQVSTSGVTWTYDPAYPRVASMVDGTGATNYTYHPAGQPAGGQLATVDGPLTNDVISYTYDQLGRVVNRAINGVPLTLTYDALGRVQQEINALGTFGYTYDGVSGRVATVTYPNNQTSAYTYYPSAQGHRLQQILHRYPTGTTLSQFDYTYDAVGNIVTWRQQADTTAVLWEYGYDAADQLIRAVKRATDPQGTILQRFAYGYDPAGNRLFEQVDDTVTAWTHDRLNRLATQQAGGLLRLEGVVNEPATVRVDGRPASVDESGLFVGGVQVAPGTTRFTVTATDGSGNTTTRQYDVDQTSAAKTFTFDANGNMTSDGSRISEWDARNQLVAVTSAGNRTEFVYDGAQRRVKMLEKENGVLQKESTTLWCGMSACESRSGGGQNVVRREFQHGDELEGAKTFVQLDHLRSVRTVTDTASVSLARYEYDPFGRRTLQSGTDLSARGFTGHYWYAASAVALAPYRPYDPALGRWMSEDPVEFEAGTNFYQYVFSSPVVFRDPLGLKIDCRSSTRSERVSRTPCGTPGCTTAQFSASIGSGAIGYGGSKPCERDDCGKWGFDALVKLDIVVRYAADPESPSADTPGATLRGHELLHVGDFRSWCQSLDSRFKSEGFPTPQSCEQAAREFLNRLPADFRRAGENSRRRDARR